MMRLSNSLLHSIKDRVRDMRYSIRAEAEAPGSALPKIVRDEIRPLLAIGSVVGTPALLIADGLFTQVETIATGILAPATGSEPLFPCPVGELFIAGPRAVNFSDRLYGPIKDLLRRHAARQMLVSEQALDMAWRTLKSRHFDTLPHGAEGQPLSDETRRALVQVCAGLACALVEARPIKKVVFQDVRHVRKHFMLSPNLYCGMVVGLATAIVTLTPDLALDGEAVLESVDSVVDARFDRFKQATTSKAPNVDLAKAFEEVLPFLP